MRLIPISTLLFTIALLFEASPTNADVIAFSGSTCDGNEGANVACQDECIKASNRHSVLVEYTTHYFSDLTC